MTQSTVEQIDALLPQTQCGKCSYAGCRPYAEALVHANEMINLCPPGGVATLVAIAKVLEKNAAPFIEQMRHSQKLPARAKIREPECIGCTKCIQACPVDAIIGSAKQMHTILVDECTGCELCVAPCPVDCIDIIPLNKPSYQPLRAKKRYQARQQRLINKHSARPAKPVSDKQAAIAAAIARVKAKKMLQDGAKDNER